MSAVASPLRLAILDDYEVVVRGLAAMLAVHRDRVQVVELDNRMPVASHVDVVLVDAFGYLPGDGIDVADLVHPGGPKVVVFGATTNSVAVQRALDEGADGYLSKSITAAELVDALEAIQSGARVVPSCQKPASNSEGQVWPGEGFALSSREAEMMSFIAKGMSNQEIAETVYLSINSVKTYVRTAYRKIGVTRRSQATLWALEHGFAVDHRRMFPDQGQGPQGSS